MKIRLIRFDFSNYKRLPVPKVLNRVRESVLKTPISQMKFWALKDFNLESAPVLEEKEVNLKENRNEKLYVANAEIANKIVFLYQKLEKIKDISNYIQNLDENITLANELEKENRKEDLKFLDKHICEENEAIEEFLIKQKEEINRIKKEIKILVEEYKKSISLLTEKELKKFKIKYFDDYNACETKISIHPFYPEIIEISS